MKIYDRKTGNVLYAAKTNHSATLDQLLEIMECTIDDDGEILECGFLATGFYYDDLDICSDSTTIYRAVVQRIKGDQFGIIVTLDKDDALQAIETEKRKLTEKELQKCEFYIYES